MLHLQAEFHNNSSVEDEILVLLTRHVRNTKRTSDFVALHVEVEDHLVLASDFQELLSSRVSSLLWRTDLDIEI